MKILILTLALLMFAGSSFAQGTVVNDDSIRLFASIPSTYKMAAQNKRVMYVGRSLGANLNDSIKCLGYTYATAPSYCKTTPAGSVPETWSGSYPSPNWTYFGWPGLGLPNPVSCTQSNGYWWGYQPCFLSYITPRLANWDVVGFFFDYLMGLDANNPVANYFANRAGNDDAYDFATFTNSISPKQTIAFTISPMKSDATSPGALKRINDFNVAMRNIAAQNGWYLFDFADITTEHGTCTYGGYPAICNSFSKEVNGGHISTGYGRIRLAKAWFVMMAETAGWRP